MEKIQMTKKFFLACIIALLCCTGNNTANAQEIDTDSIFIKIWVTDAIGNSDTIWVTVKNDGIPELESVNLYGIPPQGDLDLRIVLRTDSNAIHPWYKTPY